MERNDLLECFSGKSVRPTKGWSELDASHYIRPYEEPAVVQKACEILEPAKQIQNIFSESDLEWLYRFAFSECGRVRHNKNGTILLSGNLQKCFDQFREQILKILPKAEVSPVVGGNFFITPNQYGLHNDAPRKQDYVSNLLVTPEESEKRRYVSWRNVIIPIWVAPPTVKSQVVFFNQRHVDWAHVYNHGEKTSSISTTYPMVTDMTDLQFYNSAGRPIPKELNNKPYPREHFQSFFQSASGKELTPSERLTGLTPEVSFDWDPGSIMTFDSTQLHATNDGQNLGAGWNLKMGLLLKFLYPL